MKLNISFTTGHLSSSVGTQQDVYGTIPEVKYKTAGLVWGM